MDDFWSHCLAHFERSLNPQQLNTWIRPLSIQQSPGKVVVTAPNNFVAQWVRNKFLTEVQGLAREFFQEETEVSLIIAAGKSQAPREQTRAVKVPTTPEVPSSKVEAAQAPEPTQVNESRINHQFNFDNFVAGKANDLARAAALQVADNPGSGYNPFSSTVAWAWARPT